MQTFAKIPIRIVVIDDSITMRHMYEQIFSDCADIDLVGMSKEGTSGIEMVCALHPDIVLLDIDMPGMDGLAVLSRLREKMPQLSVIMCSTLTQQGATITLEALFRGAVDYVAKPRVQLTRETALKNFSTPLLERIRALGSRICVEVGAQESAVSVARQLRMESVSDSIGVVVMGASTGGPQALERVLQPLSADFPVPFLVVQHIPPMFVPLLADRLQKHCQLQVREAVEGTPLEAGTVWIARGDWHLRIGAIARSKKMESANILAVQRLTQDAPIHYCRPAVDALFQSAAEVYGAATLAIVLTGMGSDATEGARAIRAVGGTVLVQDAATSTIWGMPGSVAQAGLAHAVLPLDEIAGEIVRRVRTSTSIAMRPLATLPIYAAKLRAQ